MKLFASIALLISAVLSSVTAQDTIVDIVVGSDVHNSLEAAVIGADLAGTLSGDGPFTLFAPTDAAFDALLEALGATDLSDLDDDLVTNVLLYHAVAGEFLSEDLSSSLVETVGGENVCVIVGDDGTITVNGATVSPADLEAGNGVVHVIDAVLLPPSISTIPLTCDLGLPEPVPVPEPPVPEPVPAPEPSTTIVDIVVGSEDHTSLEAAVIAADLAGTLSGEGPFTLFAPTDAAFANLLTALQVDGLGDLDIDLVTSVLLYHAVAGKVMSGDLSSGLVETVGGQKVCIIVGDEGITVNGATVAPADLEASNGVVHVIDAVLVPPGEGEMVECELPMVDEPMVDEPMVDEPADSAPRMSKGLTIVGAIMIAVPYLLLQ